jgi:hypothetical protein
MRRSTLALLVALLLLPAAQAAATGARDPITVDATVNEVAAVNGRFAAVNNDPGNNVQNPDVPVWNLWNNDGSLRAAASADPKNCGQGALPKDDCATSATHLKVSADGKKVVVVSVATMDVNLVSFFNDAGVRTHDPIVVTGTITGLAMSDSGNVVALSVDVPPASGTTTRTGQLQVYDGSGNSPMSGANLNFASPAKAVALSPDGVYVDVAAGSNYYFTVGVTTLRQHTISGATTQDTDLSSHDGWGVTGFSNGFFGLYKKDMEQTSPVAYQKKEAGETASINAVAIRRDATAFVTGTSGGTLRYYSLDTAADVNQVALVNSKTGLGSIVAAAFSADGHYLAVRSSTDSLRLYRATANTLDEVWHDTRAGMANSVALDDKGEHVLTAVGSTVIVYDAIHKLTGSLPSANQQPGTTANYTVTYRNDGNRVEDVTLTSAPPSGVSVSVNPSTFSVAAGSSKSVTVTVTLPSTRAPGATNVPITRTLAGVSGPDGIGSDTLAVTVPTVHNLVLEVAGADSLGVSPGAAAVFQVLARNAGNVQESGELTLSGVPTGWTSAVDPTSINLAPGSFANVSVSLSPPSGAPNLSQAHVVLSRSGGGSTDLTATVGAGFKVRLNAPQGIILAPGVAGLLNFTVVNDGNAPDTIAVRLANLPTGWEGGFLSGLSEQRVEDLQPGQSAVVQATVRPSADAAATGVPIQVTAIASSLGDPSKTATRAILVTVEEPAGSSSESSSTAVKHKSPAVESGILLAGLAAAAMLRRKANR